MIISDALIRYLRIVCSKSLEGNSYQLDDPVIRRYEILREYANSDFSAQKLNGVLHLLAGVFETTEYKIPSTETMPYPNQLPDPETNWG